MNKWVVGIIALVIGAVAGYFYGQRDVSALTEQVSALETKATEAAEAATAAAAEEIDGLKTQVADLEAKLEAAMSSEAPMEEAPAEEMPATEEQPAATEESATEEEPAAQ